MTSEECRGVMDRLVQENTGFRSGNIKVKVTLMGGNTIIRDTEPTRIGDEWGILINSEDTSIVIPHSSILIIEFVGEKIHSTHLGTRIISR